MGGGWLADDALGGAPGGVDDEGGPVAGDDGVGVADDVLENEVEGGLGHEGARGPGAAAVVDEVAGEGDGALGRVLDEEVAVLVRVAAGDLELQVGVPQEIVHVPVRARVKGEQGAGVVQAPVVQDGVQEHGGVGGVVRVAMARDELVNVLGVQA